MIIFDGHDLETLFICGNPSISLFSSTPNYIDVSDMDGKVVNGSTLNGSTVSFSIAAVGDAAKRRHAFSVLGKWLDVDEAKPLVLPDTPDRYYLAVPDGALDLQRAFGAEYTTITFQITETAAYGEERSITVPSGGEVSFMVDGTCSTKPTITSGGASRGSGALVWGLRLDEGDFVHVATGTSGYVPVEIDCGKRTMTVNSNVMIPTLDSDWLEFSPGEHTLRMDYGTGAAVVTWRERWW